MPARVVPEGAPAYAPQFGGELRQYQDIPKKGELDDDLARALIHGYHAATSYMDAQVGRVLDALDASAQAGNTIIVLWGDHGWHLGDHGMWCKHTNYEQAARIPLIVAGPGVRAGVSQALIETVDLYPTIGASGGVAGLTGAAVRFIFQPIQVTVDPDTGERIVLGRRLATIGEVLRHPTARIFTLTWIVLNGLVPLLPMFMPGMTVEIAWQAHIGGFLFGFLAVPLFERRQP